MARYVFDIETDNLLYGVTKLHCIATHNIDTGSTRLYSGGDLQDGLSALGSASLLIGHGICNYDVPALKKLYPMLAIEAQLIDTLITGCLLYPDERFMSLESWAIKLRLKEQKVQHTDWSIYSPEMGQRCISDVSINYDVYKYLIRNPEYSIIGDALDTEQKVALIHAVQAHHGVSFDVAEAVLLVQELDVRIEERRAELLEIAPWSTLLLGVPKCRQDETKAKRCTDVIQDIIPQGTCLPLKKDGTYNEATKKYFGLEYINKVQGAYSKVEIRPMNPDSDDEVKDLLLSVGWAPTEWNFKKNPDGSFYQGHDGQRQVTSPKLTEDSYDSLPAGLGKLVAEYRMMNHRRNSLCNKTDPTKGAIASVRDDGRVSADAFTCGTNTGRYRHSGTVCNIPRPSSPYGPQIRGLFRVPDDKVMVGVDLSGIEARCLAWYLLRGNYTDAQKTADLILSPDKTNDFHSYNALQWDVSRDTAKSTLYALLYGAGAVKLAQTAGKPESMGAKLKKDFYKAHPGIRELMDDLEGAYSKRKYILGIDGRPLYIRSKSKLLNTLLQSTAAVVFKKWMIHLAELKVTLPVFKDVQQIIAYHDELQFECPPEVAARWMQQCEEAAFLVGKEMGSFVPITAESKSGKDWSQCH